MDFGVSIRKIRYATIAMLFAILVLLSTSVVAMEAVWDQSIIDPNNPIPVEQNWYCTHKGGSVSVSTCSGLETCNKMCDRYCNSGGDYCYVTNAVFC